MKKILIVLAVAIVGLVLIFLFKTDEQVYQSVYRGNERETFRILFVGDLMFDRTIRTTAEKNGYDYLFSCIGDYLRGFDLVVGNLEGPITNETSVSQNTKPSEVGNTTFTFDIDVAKTLFKNNIKMVNLGNNHILDFGLMGRDSTERELSRASVGYFGSPGDSIMATTTLYGYTLAIINFNQFIGENNPQKTISAIGQASGIADLVAVYTHWGDEYVLATEYEKTLAHSFIDAGADIVIGSHPHIIQEHEIYRGKNIYYSLGNFIFDQYFMDEVKIGGGVEIVFAGDEFSEREVSEKEVLFDIHPDGTTCLAEN
ncbi:MAG: CapA family protein [bacterium]|nr:CapA family protein [bacterium]